MKKFIPATVYVNLPQTCKRLEWSELLCRNLARSIKAWQQRPDNGWQPKISEDRLGCDWILRLNSPPPLTNWGYRYGDVVHNMRSTLDNAVYECAARLGVKPKHLNNLIFPICDNEAEWEKIKSERLYSLPQNFLDILKNIQPFCTSDANLKSHLIALRKLNNNDKHKAPIVSAGVLSGQEVTIDLERYQNDQFENWHLVFSYPNILLEDGAVSVRMASQERIGKVKGGYRLDLKLVAISSNGEQFMLLGSLAWMLDTVIKASSRIAAYSPPSES